MVTELGMVSFDEDDEPPQADRAAMKRVPDRICTSFFDILYIDYSLEMKNTGYLPLQVISADVPASAP